ncbi:aldehyde dehydrogenase [Saccharopolyspora hirsuta]|uniref:Aldehyde dehydrogenase n=1 Tax=Saccharopolyspora hirsuta TaxID=1837 RepID=A0A5M7CE69_SACHI|nr:aldehyde dehydrogenase family protein [Saccharopolyspora hirsuta]KAA5837981.1 aldehyde dehydrogenase [Saccharopolyspora hirsuta]
MKAPIQPVNPATLEPLEPAEQATNAEIGEAVSEAALAMRTGWPREHRRRAQSLNAWADLLGDHSSELADDLVRETGKPIGEAHKEVAGAIDALQFNAGLARLPLGRAAGLPDGTEAHLVREPVGPTVFITPWNWPVLLLLRDLAPAFAAGVTALVKPAPQTTHITRRVIALGHRAGVPREALHVLPGDADVGAALVTHPDTRAVAITGSTEAGQAVMRAAAATMTRPLLELGGKASMIVLEDADLEAAVEVAARAAVITSGQMCMACTRILVHAHHAKDAEKLLRERMAALTPGDPRDESTDLGPLISEAAMNKVLTAVDRAREDGRVLVGGHQVRPDGLPGHFLTPVLVSELDPRSPVVQEDIFGPLLSLEVFDSDEAAIELANATSFGLAAAVWTRDLARGFAVARELQAGTVWLNGYNHSYAEMPSGGVRMSGMGRTRGIEGVEQFTELKHVHFPVGL